MSIAIFWFMFILATVFFVAWLVEVHHVAELEKLLRDDDENARGW